MTIEEEILLFDQRCELLNGFIRELSVIGRDEISSNHRFLAEATMFQLFRSYERFVRFTFLHYCVHFQSFSGRPVISRLKCDRWEVAEDILKSGNKFLDWGNVDSVKQIANLVFEGGFPVNDLISPVFSTLKDMQRFRNYIAHDSREAEDGFRKAREQYVRVGSPMPQTVGELAVYRRTARADITIKIVFGKVSKLGDLLKTL